MVRPGYVDLQCNGAYGIDLAREPRRLWELGARLVRHGVVAWLPTIVTSAPAVVAAAQAALLGGPPPGYAGATPLGLHLEGPLLAPAFAGAHDPGLLRTPVEVDPSSWTPAGGVRLVTLAPELPGALDLVGVLARRGVVVAIGHTGTDDKTCREAMDRGASLVTHLWNAATALHHRAPGVVGAALDDARVRASLIVDGVHVDPVVVRLTWRLLGPDRFVLVSDAVAVAGATAPAATLATRAVRIGADGAVRDADGRLAGSGLLLDAAVRNLARFTGCSLAEAAGAASRVPAAVLAGAGSPPRSLDGCATVLDAAGAVVETWVGGRRVFAQRA